MFMIPWPLINVQHYIYIYTYMRGCICARPYCFIAVANILLNIPDISLFFTWIEKIAEDIENLNDTSSRLCISVEIYIL